MKERAEQLYFGIGDALENQGEEEEMVPPRDVRERSLKPLCWARCVGRLSF